MVMDALEREKSAFTPRNYKVKTRLVYNALNDEFEEKDLIKAGFIKSNSGAYTTTCRWEKDNLIKKLPSGKWKKIIKTLN